MIITKEDLIPRDNFNTFVLHITFESQKEAEAIFACLNYTPNCNVIRAHVGYNIPEQIRDAMGDFRNTSGTDDAFRMFIGRVRPR